jgi:hypothetical protein
MAAITAIAKAEYRRRLPGSVTGFDRESVAADPRRMDNPVTTCQRATTASERFITSPRFEIAIELSLSSAHYDNQIKYITIDMRGNSISRNCLMFLRKTSGFDKKGLGWISEAFVP